MDSKIVLNFSSDALNSLVLSVTFCSNSLFKIFNSSSDFLILNSASFRSVMSLIKACIKDSLPNFTNDVSNVIQKGFPSPLDI